MWEFSSVVTATVEILMSAASASVIAGHSAADLCWEEEPNYVGRTLQEAGREIDRT